MQRAAVVLIVDDDPATLDAMQQWVARMGYGVITAKNGVEALDNLRSTEAVDAIISDIRMPELDGLQFAAWARKLRPGTPVILMTGVEGAVEDALASGSVALLKPFRYENVERLLTEALNRSRPAQTH